jgi:hypothetical protein
VIFNRERTHSDEKRETLSLPLHDMATLTARVEMGIGDLEIAGGAAADEVLHGDITMPPDFDIDVDLHVSGERGDLRVKQETPKFSARSGNHMNRWRLALNDAIPTDLRVEQSTGTSRLLLSPLNLTGLVVDRSVGETLVELAGEHRQLTNVNIHSSTGEATVRMTGQFEELDLVRVDGSIGQITVDLCGQWGRNLDGRFKTSTGEIKLLLPSDVGIEVTAKTSIGSVTARGFTRDGKTWRNGAFGRTPVTLRLVASTSIGAIRLETAG